MNARRFALFAALALFAIFVASNLIANSWFRGARLDLTQNHLYSLSPGTREVLSPRELTEPVALTFYFSREAASQSAELSAYGARVREMLQTYVAAARGRVRLIEVDPQPFSEEEDQASAAGVEPVTLRQGGDPIYFGLAGANSIDDKRSIPFFDGAREQFLEYEITRLIYELENPEPPHVALISSLPLGAENGPRFSFAQELERFARVTRVAPNFTELPADARVLVMIHPGPLTPGQLYAIDQFVLRHGRAFIALDPASMAASAFPPSLDPAAPSPATSSMLAPLLSRWGVSLPPDVVLDGENALPIQTQDPNGRPVQAPQPLFFRVDPAHLAQNDLMTAPLKRGLNFGLAGAFAASERPGLTLTPLARTTGETMRIPAERALMRPTPFELMNAWAPTGRSETVALRLSGTLETAFPTGAPPDAAPPRTGERNLARSATPAEIVLVADTDFLADDFYLQPDTGASFADNAAFALNAIDILGGSQALVGLRARAPSLRPLTLLDNLENDAQRRIERRQQDLQAELQDTETRLARIRARGQGSGFFSGDLGAELTPQERAEMQRFTTRVAQVRGELRSVGRDLRREIDQVKAVVVFVNMWLFPLLVAGIGLYVFWRRQRQPRHAQARGKGGAS